MSSGCPRSAQPTAVGTRSSRRVARGSRERAGPGTMNLMTEPHPSAAAFRSARDLLLRHRDDYAAARREFSWPALDEFNWALDWFDVIAAEHPDQTALRIVADGDAAARLSYGELAARSNRVANWLSELGARRGDRLLLMLGNIAPLWEVILAAMKLGVVIIPASTLLSPDDLADRIDRGNVRFVVTETAQREKFQQLPDFGAGGWTPVLVEPGAAGKAGPWHRYAEASGAPAEFVPDGPTAASDPLLLYFTSGTTAQPKLVEHTHVSYPVGHLSTVYWIGLRPGDVHLNISSPGWAKHAWSNVFAPWNAEATALILGYERFNAELLLKAIGEQGVSTFCAPPTVWRMLIQADLGAADVSALRECVAAGEPLNPEVIERVRQAWRITVRDGYGQTETTAQVGNCPGQPLKLGSMGRPLPGYTVSGRPIEPSFSGWPGQLPTWAVVSVCPYPSRTVIRHACLTRSMTSGLSGSPAATHSRNALTSAAPRSAWMSIRHTVGGAQNVLTPCSPIAFSSSSALNRS